MTRSNEKIVLGAEHDATLFSALRAILAELKGVSLDSSWGVGGSQEITEWMVKIGDDTLMIQAETYEGLSISGKPELVQKIAELMRQRIPQKNT